ncbi:hypothetical protein [Chitinophaga arvensicola]|uniref:Tetratricopeptide repeat-containing protein n=1 Tax=Chitinophaga arvensicola TaxID=29529 RepID=A0A1I0S748_9BACT|nr:hypothetical protein [Chitinophaga arvensicola]SEW51567.1 hypothetical protein SAMN04488122_4323 [Chitinophaga arvensicola]
MNWKVHLEQLERNKDWKSATVFMQQVIDDNPDQAEVYISIIYLLHNILVEEDYPESDHDYFAKVLGYYFEKSYKKFSDNAEYLFFAGKILHIAEWYFGVDDDLKPIEKRLAFQMQKSAFEKEKSNVLFEWAYRFSLGDGIAEYLADQILLYDKAAVEWLKSKGFPGYYVLGVLEQHRKRQNT